MKKILADVLVAACMMSMVACGKQDTTAGTSISEEVSTADISSTPTEKEETVTTGATGSLEALGIPVVDLLSGLEEEYEVLMTTIVDYDTYVEHKSEIDEFYAKIIGESDKTFGKLTALSLDYFRYIFTEYEDDEKELERAIDDYYDEVYSGILGDYYDDVYSGILSDMYDDIYSEIIGDAYDDVAYREWSESSTDAYRAWSDTSTDVYRLWLNQSSCCYRMWSEASSQYYKGNQDVDDVMEQIMAAKDESEELENTSFEESITGDSAIKESSEETTETEDGVTPEFKELMDSYEEFFNEYVDFINKYKNAEAEDMVALMGDYADYMTKYAEMMEKMQKMEKDDLPTQDVAYYVEVTARINQKLLTVAE